ncbi:unnamed protein product [Prorocentrum cordatum]|uniref:Uncharacterized protein n=1 Tax=Prorocentrum cordatum TaxID=2364126 RepID=A0ABN9V4E6_9DINO|nr:unnamed protein product [Polarella glacialis]
MSEALGAGGQELISLRADVDVDLLDHEGAGAILSRSKGDPTNPLLATYRMQEPGSRFQIKLRTVEGLNGNISCFVLPQTNPKTAHLVTLAVKPLSLHEKISEVPPDVPMNELRLVGPFTIEYMHQWISLCVNELPSRPTGDQMVICYRTTSSSRLERRGWTLSDRYGGLWEPSLVRRWIGPASVVRTQPARASGVMTKIISPEKIPILTSISLARPGCRADRSPPCRRRCGLEQMRSSLA